MDDSADNAKALRIAEPGDACPNCGESLRGQWCYRCGQNQRSIHRFFFVLLGDLLEDVFAWNSRTAQTFYSLLFRPGHLAKEFFAGRRARYLPPIRLYLITSFTFFFLLSVQSSFDLFNVQIDDPAETEVTELQTSAQPEAEAAESKPDAPGNKLTDQLKQSDVHVNIPWLSPEQKKQVEGRLNRQLAKLGEIGAEDPGAIIDAALDVVPPAVFVLLPVFALLLKIFYFSFGFYYIEHLVLAVSNHSFVFAVLTLETLLGMLPAGTWGIGELTGIIFVWIPVYMFLSLRSVYGQGWFATFVNFTLLGLFYCILLGMVTMSALFVGLLTL